MTEPHDITAQIVSNSPFKKVKQHMLFGLLLLVCALFLVWQFMPSKKPKTEKIDSETSISSNTLSDNLALIARMREEANTIQAKIETLPKSINHPPKLRKQNKVPNLSKELVARMNAPTSFNLEAGSASQSSEHQLFTGNDGNSQFMNAQHETMSVSAKRLPHPDETVPAGEVIPAILETGINSELAGMVRAVVTENVYALTGNHCLIPKGAILTGQFNAGVVQGQSRILVIWTRVRMPDGVIVTLNSPSTDTLGRSGLSADSVNTHFLRRFGSSILLSVLGGYAANEGVNGGDEYNSKAQYRMDVANSLQKASSATLDDSISVKPTLTKNQGALIHVFVAYDLDFHGISFPYDTAGVVWKE